jgi:hypothetical protein
VFMVLSFELAVRTHTFKRPMSRHPFGHHVPRNQCAEGARSIGREGWASLNTAAEQAHGGPSINAVRNVREVASPLGHLAPLGLPPSLQ